MRFLRGVLIFLDGCGEYLYQGYKLQAYAWISSNALYQAQLQTLHQGEQYVCCFLKESTHSCFFIFYFIFLVWQNLEEKKVENITWENYCEQVSKMGVRKTGARGVREVDLLFMMQDRGIQIPPVCFKTWWLFILFIKGESFQTVNNWL